jgi:hypothetical protein
MIFNKQECGDSIAQYLERSNVWRRSLADKFPDDVRLPRAAETLSQLALAAVELNDEHWGLLKPYFGGWASETWRSALGQAARQIGFSHRQRSFDSFVRLLVRQFPQNESVAA